MSIEILNRYTQAANLEGANLEPIRDDFWDVLDSAPDEVPALLAALRAGKVDGSTYTGECACLVGTIAKARGCSVNDIPGVRPDSDRPAERWFMMISPGHTPENHGAAKTVEDWILEWQAGPRAATTEAPAAEAPQS